MTTMKAEMARIMYTSEYFSAEQPHFIYRTVIKSIIFKVHEQISFLASYTRCTWINLSPDTSQPPLTYSQLSSVSPDKYWGSTSHHSTTVPIIHHSSHRLDIVHRELFKASINEPTKRNDTSETTGI
jgi:hypothetical protein